MSLDRFALTSCPSRSCCQSPVLLSVFVIFCGILQFRRGELHEPSFPRFGDICETFQNCLVSMRQVSYIGL
jgi:hypothetical protein